MKKIILFLLPIVLTSCLTNNEIINEIFYGIFEDNNLPKPQFCIQCIDDSTAKNTVLFLNDILPRIAKILPPFLALKKQITDFVSSFDGNIVMCLGYSYQIQFLGQKFGIQAGSSVEDIEHDFIRYFEFHYPKAHASIKQFNELWQSKKYHQLGTHVSKFVHTVVDTK